MATLKQGTAAHTFCEIPLALAEATVTIIEQGRPKVNQFINLAFKTTSHVNLQNQCMKMILFQIYFLKIYTSQKVQLKIHVNLIKKYM